MWWLALLYMLTRKQGAGASGWSTGVDFRDPNSPQSRAHASQLARSHRFHRMQQYGANRPQVHQSMSVDPNDPAVVQDPATGAFVRQAMQVDPTSLDPGYASQLYGGVAYPGFDPSYGGSAGYGAAPAGYGGTPPTGYGGYYGGYDGGESDDDPFSQWDEWMAANGQ